MPEKVRCMKYLTCFALLLTLILCPAFPAAAQDASEAEQKQQDLCTPSQQEETQQAVLPREEPSQRVGRIFVRLLSATDIEKKVGYQVAKNSEQNAFAAPLKFRQVQVQLRRDRQ